jgi:hypothetical protein
VLAGFMKHLVLQVVGKDIGLTLRCAEASAQRLQVDLVRIARPRSRVTPSVLRIPFSKYVQPTQKRFGT